MRDSSGLSARYTSREVKSASVRRSEARLTTAASRARTDRTTPLTAPRSSIIYPVRAPSRNESLGARQRHRIGSPSGIPEQLANDPRSRETIEKHRLSGERPRERTQVGRQREGFFHRRFRRDDSVVADL